MKLNKIIFVLICSHPHIICMRKQMEMQYILSACTVIMKILTIHINDHYLQR